MSSHPDSSDESRLGEVAEPALRAMLAREGLLLDLGTACVRVRTDLPEFSRLLRAAYENSPVGGADGLADAEVVLRASRGLRKWINPQATIEIDGIDPFEAFPREQLLPYFEWGVNWLFAHTFNSYLLLHAGSLEVEGSGLLLVAQPASGKSTLTAALSGRGHRVLSDEFGILRRSDLHLLALTKPIALKNDSIQVIRRWSPGARFGPVYRNTRKGVLTHHALPASAVRDRFRAVPCRVVIFPIWGSGRTTVLTPVAPARAFMELAANSFNYDTLGPDGFDAVRGIVETCPAYRLEYSNLDDAVPRIVDLCRSLRGDDG